MEMVGVVIDVPVVLVGFVVVGVVEGDVDVICKGLDVVNGEVEESWCGFLSLRRVFSSP